jgi:hypothetical protein
MEKIERWENIRLNIYNTYITILEFSSWEIERWENISGWGVEFSLDST